MIDFSKKIGSSSLRKPIDPIELYESLDRRSETGPLRKSQVTILAQWFNERRDDRDIIIKLHTGEGKTLIGLLLLASRINEGKGPCLYLCPTKHLVNQTAKEARRFGIPFCLIDDDNRDIPSDFIDGKRLLLCTAQKLFNGKTKFHLDRQSIPVNTLIMDDSHACIDAIRGALCIRTNNETRLYKSLLSLFKSDLEIQGSGSFLDISSGVRDALMLVPYWSWNDKSDAVLTLLSDEMRTDDSLEFRWPFIKDNIKHWQCFVSTRGIEISPYTIPIKRFGSFHNASQRILMSATTQDDSFMVKDLEISKKAVVSPLTDPDSKWSGEKLFIIPALVEYDIDRSLVVSEYAPPKIKEFGVVALVPSKALSDIYTQRGAIVANTDNIDEILSLLEQRKFENTIVLVNRYDGIDLPDDECRILILDSMPYFPSLADQYSELALSTSNIIKKKIAQKIEQGMGRSVRGERDYSVIILIGNRLVNFIKCKENEKYFSRQTRMQLEIARVVTDSLKEEMKESSNRMKTIHTLSSQVISRDEGWKAFYRQSMDGIDVSDSPLLVDIFEAEKYAETLFQSGDFDRAESAIQAICDSYSEEPELKGWFLQTLARYRYETSHDLAFRTQESSTRQNYMLLKPPLAITYRKIPIVQTERIQRIRESITSHSTHIDLMLYINSLSESLSFQESSEVFEKALDDLGKLLGFDTQRPDKQFNKGFDNMWYIGDRRYICFECKSQVKADREEISKDETGQFNNHCAWFRSEYPDSTGIFRLIIPTNKKSPQADFSDEMKVITHPKLQSLKKNVELFFMEFRRVEVASILAEDITRLLVLHKLDVAALMQGYSDEIR